MGDLTPSPLPFLASVLVSGSLVCQNGFLANQLVAYRKAIEFAPRTAVLIPPEVVKGWSMSVTQVLPSSVTADRSMALWFEYQWPWPSIWYPYVIGRVAVAISLVTRDEIITEPTYVLGSMGLASMDGVAVMATVMLVAWRSELETAEVMATMHYAFDSEGQMMGNQLVLVGFSVEDQLKARREFMASEFPPPPVFMTGPAWAIFGAQLGWPMEEAA